MLNISFIILAYLAGSINFAIIISKLAGLPDPRTQGSGNPGATNILRYGGKKLALLVIVGDTAKGLIPVVFARWIGVEHMALAWTAIAAVLGHMYPIFFRFQGGKGVATVFGAILGLSWLIGLLAFITWMLVAIIFRYSSLASLVTTIVVPLYIYCFSQRCFLLPIILVALIIIYRHRANIKRLVKGQEPKIGNKPAKS